MGSKGFGKVPASKWCKMQQNQWFSLVFQGFTKQNDRIPWKVLEGNQVELIKKYIYIYNLFFFMICLMIFYGFQGFLQGSSLQVAKCSKNICWKKTLKTHKWNIPVNWIHKKKNIYWIHKKKH